LLYCQTNEIALGNKEIRDYFIYKFDPVDRMYKEVSDQILVGTVEGTAVYWSGVIKIMFVFLCLKT
jgi:hypothetical protein